MLLLAGLAPPALGQSAGCDPGIEAPARDPLRYERRGDRCEGLFEEQFSAALEIVYFRVRGADELSFGDHDSLRLAWSPPDLAAPVRLHARGVRHDLTNYRMDYPPAGLRPSGTSYDWSLDVIQRLGVAEVAREDIGLIGWTELQGIDGPVLLPLAIGTLPEDDAPDSYLLELRPGARLERIWYSLAPIGDDGEPGDYLVFQQSLGEGFPAGRLVRIEIPFETLPGSGVYQLAFHTRPGRSSSEPSLTRWFYHAAR